MDHGGNFIGRAAMRVAGGIVTLEAAGVRAADRHLQSGLDAGGAVAEGKVAEGQMAKADGVDRVGVTETMMAERCVAEAEDAGAAGKQFYPFRISGSVPVDFSGAAVGMQIGVIAGKMVGADDGGDG